ncbi:MAG TPA: glycerophosphodiester phosphodiesterase family protein [Clostridiaceae bacterium]
MITIKKYFILIIITFITINSFREVSFVKSTNKNAENITVVAHRGICRDEPENSMSAIKSDIKNKLEWAEIDVQETKEGSVVLMHDKYLKRLTGINITVNKLNLDEIEKLNLINLFSTKYKKEKIPSLEEIIRTCKGKLKLVIELKSYGKGNSLSGKVVKIIEENNFVEECVVQSLDYKNLLYVKELNAKIITGYLMNFISDYEDYYKVDFYTVKQSIISRVLVKSIHKNAKKIFAWNVNSKKVVIKMIELNVDGIITNKPLLINEIKASSRK